VVVKHPARHQPDRHHRRRADLGGGELDDRTLRELARPVTTPDLTGSIMGRLGYMRASHHVARRRRLRRQAGRAALLALLLCAAIVAVDVHQHGPEARRPEPVTVPAAFGREVARQQQRIRGTIAALRELAPARPRADDADADEMIDEDVDRSAVGPVRWM
jgi:hypothetical protein